MNFELTYDLITLILCSTLVLLAIITPLCSAFFRRVRVCKSEDVTTSTVLPQYSIIMSVHDNARELERHLPSFLEQKYAANYEVIIVDESSTDDTEDILKQLSARYPNLYTTFIPQSSHYLSRRKLALTVGVKAAKYEWIILTDVGCIPSDDQWLTALASHHRDGINMIIGHCNYAEKTPSYWLYERLMTASYQLRRALRSVAYRCECPLLVFRKQQFMEQNGFLANLKLLRGEYDFIVNEYATREGTAIAIEPASQLVQQCPSKKTRRNEHLYYLETRKYLARGWRNRLLFNFDQWMLHLNNLAQISTLAYALLTGNGFLLVTVGILLLSTITIRTIIIHRTALEYNTKLPIWKIPFLECSVVWRNAWLMILHRCADKYDFIRR